MRMKPIKNMRGLLKSLSLNGYLVLRHTDDMVVVYVDSVLRSKVELENLYSSRLSYLHVFVNCYSDIVLDVKFY